MDDGDNRDYKNLHNPKLAVYNFRGYTVLRFYKDEKRLEFGDNANMCHFCPEDYQLMAAFLVKCHLWAEGKLSEFENTEVD